MANPECRRPCPNEWSEWSTWLSAGLHARNRWRLPVLVVGILFAQGRRTVTTWAPRRRGQRRLPGLLLLLGGPRTQERIDRRPVGNTSAADVAVARTSAAGDRRLANQALRAESRRCRRASQPNAGSGRSAVFVRPCVGDDFVGAQASAVGNHRLAAASAALCSQANDGNDPQGARLAAVCDQVAVGGAAGGVDRPAAETSGKKPSGSSSMEGSPSGRF